MAALLDSHDNFVVHEWIEDPSNTVEVGSTENVSTEDSAGSSDSKRRPVWTRESTHWLMEEMKLFESRNDKHQVKKRVVYEELADKFSEANFNIHWEAIQKKWQNLMSTYWRNLKKPKKAGQWEYFTEMDSILRNTTVWVGLNGCKDPNVSNSLYYSDDSDSRLWSTERILMMLEDMQQLEKGDEHKGRRNIFHKVATNFQRCGHAIDWKAVQKKWHNLMSTYKRNLQKPREEVIWEYFDAMESVNRRIPSHFRSIGPEAGDSLLPTPYDVSKAHSEEESAWTHDNTLWLLEEMLAVKERRDKHLLKNRVVFREIADTFNAEHFDVDWKQVLKKWQAMYIMYSKILRGVVQPGNWQYFERMHSIVGDTDMYVGVGAKKSEEDEKEYPDSTETVYHYINPEDNSQYILTSSQSAAAAKYKDLTQNLTDNLVKQRDQYVEFDTEFVTSEYIVASASPKADKNEQFLMEISTSNASNTNSLLSPAGTIIASNNTMGVHTILSQQKDSENNDNIVFDGKPSEGLSPELRIGSIMMGRGGFKGFNDGDILIESCTVKEEADLLEEAGGIVLEDGIVFEEPADSEGFQNKENLMEMDAATEDSSEGSGNIELECNGSIESIVNQENGSEGLSNFENEEAMLEISEIDFLDESPPKRSNELKDQNTLTFVKEGVRKRKMVHSNGFGRPTNIKITKLTQLS